VWLVEALFEGLLEWAAQTRPSWLLLLLGLALAVAGWFTLRLNVYAGLALTALGVGTAAYGVFLMLGKGDE
jgi:hypothetical protein